MLPCLLAATSCLLNLQLFIFTIFSLRLVTAVVTSRLLLTSLLTAAPHLTAHCSLLLLTSLLTAHCCSSPHCSRLLLTSLLTAAPHLTAHGCCSPHCSRLLLTSLLTAAATAPHLTAADLIVSATIYKNKLIVTTIDKTHFTIINCLSITNILAIAR